ncbi:MAG: extracellular solute-binding protein, partial [Pseudomonadota bacterium]
LARDLVSLNAPLNEFLTAAADTAVVRGQTLGLPHHLAVTVLFVRNDVIEESVSVWTELRDRLLQAPTDGATGLSIGAAGPATFPFFLDWYYSTGGIDLTDRQAVRDALSLLAELIGAVAISGAPTARAADAVNQFARGSTAALVTRSTQRPAVSKSEIAERIAVRTRPHLNQGGRSPALVSTWLLGVSRFSRNKEPAKALATYLTSEEVQRSAAIEFGLAPTRETVLTDEDVKAAGPILAELHELGPSLRAPPVDLYGLHYLDLADAVAGEVRGLFAGDLTVDAAANAIVRDARRAERLGEGE